MRVFSRGNRALGPINKIGVVGREIVRWPGIVRADQFESMLHGFDEGAAKAFAAVQGDIDVGYPIKIR